MTPLIVTIGLGLFIAGLTLSAAALHGRFINTHPHCKGCGFDLAGLDLTEPATCPECGRTVRLGAGSIRIGKRKRRPTLLAVGLLLVLTGGAGLAWPKLAQIPSIRNFDWYAHFPEPLLLRLEASGNKGALDELHSRMISATLSENGLRNLIERSLAMMDNESVPWDERWGDVLLYALVTQKMEQEELEAYFESLYQPHLYTHDLVSTDAPFVKSELVIYSRPRGFAGLDFYKQLRDSASPAIYDAIVALTFELDVGVDITSSGESVALGDRTTKQSGAWYPAQWSGYTNQAKAKPFPDQRRIDFSYHCTMRVLLDGQPLHQWQIDARASSTLVDAEVEYAKPLASPSVAERLAPRLMIDPVCVPADIIDAIMNKDLPAFRISSTGVQVEVSTPVGLAGELCFLNGDKEIPFADCISIPVLDPDLPGLRVSQAMGWGYLATNAYTIQYGVEEFKRDSAFWKKARERGMVDIVFRPDPSLLMASPRIKQYLDQAVVFRDVPLVYAQAQQIPGTDRWSWTYRVSLGKEKHGELYAE